MSEALPPDPERSPTLASAQAAKVAILKTADAIRRRAATLLTDRDITFRQYNVLRILRGSKSGPLSSAELAQRTIELIPDLGPLLADLESKGLARGEGGTDDPTSKRWSVTPSGVDLLGPLDGPVAEADRSAVGDLDEAEVRGLIALLERVRARS